MSGECVIFVRLMGAQRRQERRAHALSAILEHGRAGGAA